ncbi:MAG: NAD(+) synthase [Clostridiales bacterium]|nr:NAD(+) synthase [Clostridiales bacterium]
MLGEREKEVMSGDCSSDNNIEKANSLSDTDFNPEKTKCDIVKWISEWFSKNGKESPAVVAISGGKDSSVVTALCVEALGRDRVYGVLMPQGVQHDINASMDLVNHLGIDYCVINIGKTVKIITDEIESSMDRILSEQAKVNLPARIRMSTVYAVSQTMNGRVANTCNLSEDWVGYSTRYGDAAGDFSPVSGLTVHEVRAVGEALGLPKHLIYKVPEDGLSGKSDEDNLGFTYDVLDRYIRTGEIDDMKVKELIDRKRKFSRFKLELMPAFKMEAPIKAEDSKN